MGDQFEKYINQNRESFDDDFNDEKLWTEIQNSLKEDKQHFQWNYVWRIAAVLLLITTIVLGWDRFVREPVGQEPDLYAEFQKAEVFYSSMIEMKKAEISAFDEAFLTEQFKSELEELDKMYAELKNTFKDKVSNEMVIDAMINNLQLRVEILNQQISILQKLNENSNENEQLEI
jgi:hypothetical protein